MFQTNQVGLYDWKTCREWLNPFIHNLKKMLEHTFKILQLKHRKIFEACLAIFQHYEWKD